MMIVVIPWETNFSAMANPSPETATGNDRYFLYGLIFPGSSEIQVMPYSMTGKRGHYPQNNNIDCTA